MQFYIENVHQGELIHRHWALKDTGCPITSILPLKPLLMILLLDNGGPEKYNEL